MREENRGCLPALPWSDRQLPARRINRGARFNSLRNWQGQTKLIGYPRFSILLKNDDTIAWMLCAEISRPLIGKGAVP
jgi:hypothetical protein